MGAQIGHVGNGVGADRDWDNGGLVGMGTRGGEGQWG